MSEGWVHQYLGDDFPLAYLYFLIFQQYCIIKVLKKPQRMKFNTNSNATV